MTARSHFRSSQSLQASRLGDRLYRRPVRFHAPAEGSLPEEKAAALPGIDPVPPLPPLRPAQAPRTVAGLLAAVIIAVNARGMCATQAARIADLPQSEIDHILGLCQCSGCAADSKLARRR